MQKLSKIFLILGIVAAILIVGGLIGWLAGGSSSKNIPVAVNPAPVDSKPSNPSPDGHSPDLQAASEPVKIVSGGSVRPSGFAPGILTNWEEKLEEIIGSDTLDDSNKVQQLFALFPHVPAESKAEVAQHLSNLVGDNDYTPLGNLLKDGTLSDDTLDVLMQDILNRPNSLKLPELLEVAQTPDHPKADEAKDILSLFLDQDFGNDWGLWRDKTLAWLKDNPD
jgi:hypothetical protein